MTSEVKTTNVATAAYLIKTIDLSQITPHKMYDILHISGYCHATGASIAASVFSHKPKIDSVLNYDSVANLVADAVERANERDEFIRITLQVEGGMSCEDIFDACVKVFNRDYKPDYMKDPISLMLYGEIIINNASIQGKVDGQALPGINPNTHVIIIERVSEPATEKT